MRTAMVVSLCLLLATVADAAQFPISGFYGTSEEVCAAFSAEGEEGFAKVADDGKMLVTADTIRAARYKCVASGSGRPAPISCTGEGGAREGTAIFALNATGITMKLDDGTEIVLDRCR